MLRVTVLETDIWKVKHLSVEVKLKFERDSKLDDTSWRVKSGNPDRQQSTETRRMFSQNHCTLSLLC